MVNDIAERISMAVALEQTAEECIELAKASLKASRALRGENPTPVTFDDAMEAVEEELADVLVTTDVLRAKMYSKIDEDAYLNPVKKEKTVRWLNRLVNPCR